MSSRPWPSKASISIVQLPMLGISSRRRQDGSCSRQVGAPRGDLAGRPDQRDRALGGQAAGVQLGRRAAGHPLRRRRARAACRSRCATRAGARSRARSRPPGGPRSAARRPPRRAPRTAPGAGAGRSHGRRRITGPTSGSRRKRRWNSRRSWSVPSAKRMRSTPASAASRSGASARKRTRRPATQARTTAAPRLRVHHPHQRAAALQQHAVAPRCGQPVGAHGSDVDFDQRRLSVLEQVDVDEEGARGGHLGAPAAPAAAAEPQRLRRPAGAAAPSRAESRRRRAGSRRWPRPPQPAATPAARARSGAARPAPAAAAPRPRARGLEGLRAQAPGEYTRGIERQAQSARS